MVLDVNSLSIFRHARILVVGDVMLDRYWFGAVDRISPEAPVPIIAVNQIEQRVGGAGNVALNVVSVGGQCALLSVVGDDETGNQLRQILKSYDVDDLLQVDNKIKTTMKLRVISQNQQLLRADFEDKPNDEKLAQCYCSFVDYLDNVDVVVLSDYGKGGLSHIEKMIALAKERGKLVFVDPKGADFGRYRGATMVTPNLREFEQATTEPITDDEHMHTQAERLMLNNQIESLLVTLSERGMILYRLDAQPLYSPGRAREVYDVSGAGDTVIAMLALAAAAGLNDHDALALANCAAGIAVSKLGTSIVSQSELAVAIEQEGKS